MFLHVRKELRLQLGTKFAKKFHFGYSNQTSVTLAVNSNILIIKNIFTQVSVLANFSTQLYPVRKSRNLFACLVVMFGKWLFHLFLTFQFDQSVKRSVWLLAF